MTITIPLNPPTSQLPPIGKIKSTSLEDIANALSYLRLLYNSEVRGTRRIDRKVVFTTSRIASDPEAQQTLTSANTHLSHDSICEDEFERAYAVRWLTALIARADLIEARDVVSDAEDTPPSDAHAPAWAQTIEDAASLLAVCAGTASAGLVSRAFVFRHQSGRGVEMQVTDVPLENQDYSSVGAQTWGSACLLAEMIVEDPAGFGLGSRSQRSIRVLELGAGTGLVSLTIGQWLKGISGTGGSATIVATDFHPSVLQNLRNNIALNIALSPELSTVSVTAHHLDWSNLPSSPAREPFDEPFDLIFGADITYEVQQAAWIRRCVERFLRKPATCSQMANEANHHFHLMAPIRPTHTAESQSVEQVFAFANETQLSSFQPTTIGIISKEVLLCEVQGNLRSRSDGANLVEYVHYTIAWV
ncbi:hypothetical protein EUX98_g5586 [Antrodiella citrinella]|uniref:FAM86 N-terminal domain-containing protein n=1 Tax=Antrodiella citrinella TaxID=2447956 RepID=A0A4S4MR88_9APHY|nr:hypothetical protein EUX98_g5586 [Antrodiella citrinella]